MNISSLIKVFGIAAAGFVPQAQANPFGISFVKVNPPKDKKEEAICFRLKLSQTDVFSEHNFTDITFRPNTTVFLQKNMVIDDEEEILKKTFKNFNAEKDPFEIPERYLPLEDKDRAEWVDKDGKPLKFLVVVVTYDQYDWGDGSARLCISGYPKQHIFSITDKVRFLDGIDFCECEAMPNENTTAVEKMKKIGLLPSGIQCVFLKPRYLSAPNLKHISIGVCKSLFFTMKEKFYAYSVSSKSFFAVQGKMEIRCPSFYCYGETPIFRGKGFQGFFADDVSGDCVAIVACDFADGNKVAKMSFGLYEKFYGEGVKIQNGQNILFCKFYRNIVSNEDVVPSKNKHPIGVEPFFSDNNDYCIVVKTFLFIFPKEDQSKK